ncbi:nuclear envelope integral membrane protein 2 [Cricetulus griseus]|uniref:Nuclear envelope integral membrane protein 2 n=1 Tax=Cricetulus griseus TaxID=10029 RepID=A0A8C2M5F0_CRIGR|nr:nuclear envelope integral membrane protein 2 [Cricetulus griseus]ERE85765.1 transmembrane protein [Cricetulus griseus]
MLPWSWWLVLWLPPLATLPAVAVREEEAAMSVPRCKSLKETDLIKTTVSDCYCYNQNWQIEWTYMWSTVQVTVTSRGLLRFVYITGNHNCQHPEGILSFIRCVIHNFWAPEESNKMTMLITPYGETVCFSVKPIGRVFTYTVSMDRNIVDFKLLLVFMAGIFLFIYAKTLSQSPAFYYSSGTVLGVLMTPVFVLLMAKRYIPKYSTFGALMIGCWFASVYVVCQLMEDLKWLWYGNRIYVLGYILVVGLCSFAACYRHGPLADEWSRGLLMWTLRFLSLVLVYTGVAVPLFAYAVMVLLLFSWSLRYPLRAFSYLRWKMRSWFATEPLVVRFLTDDEYREQAEAATASALEELRRACCRPDFPSWLAVSRLQAPKKFADFVLGESHLSPEEVSTHETQYGLGGAFLEEQLFSLHTDSLPAS